jgi:hypothetical protein
VGHLSKLQDKYRNKGVTVIGLTGEDRRTNLRYMLHQDPGFTYKVAIGGAPGYETPQFPWSVLIAPDGTIAWQGSPARMSEKKHLKPLLADVRKPTPAELEARTKRMLSHADVLIGDALYLRAQHALLTIAADYPESAAADAARARSLAMLEIEGAAAELAAQQTIAKIIGGAETPDPEGKRIKNAEKSALKLAKLAEKYAETAPRSARLALEWRAIYLSPWE